MLWVLIRSTSLKHFWWVPTTYVYGEIRKILIIFGWKKKKGLIKILAIEVFKIVGHLLYMYFPFQISVPQPHACMVHSAYPYLMTISASAQQDTEGRTVSWDRIDVRTTTVAAESVSMTTQKMSPDAFAALDGILVCDCFNPLQTE